MKEQEPKKKKNNTLETIKELWKTPRGKAILFFVFYIIFFFGAVVLIRTNNAENTSQTLTEGTNETTQTIRSTYKLDKIEAGNYHFVREENRNGIVTTFVGDTANNRSQVMMTQGTAYKNYFLYSDIVLEQENGVYKVGINPYLYPNITTYSSIRAILSQATLKSKTEYEGANTIYQYEITTTTLAYILDQQEIDLDDPVNTIEVEVDEENEVVGITYGLNSYHAYKTNGLENALTISIKYSDFGEIAELEIPE